MLTLFRNANRTNSIHRWHYPIHFFVKQSKARMCFKHATKLLLFGNRNTALTGIYTMFASVHRSPAETFCLSEHILLAWAD